MKMTKKELYNKIMENVSVEVKNALNELSSKTLQSATDKQIDRLANDDYIEHLSDDRIEHEVDRIYAFKNAADEAGRRERAAIIRQQKIDDIKARRDKRIAKSQFAKYMDESGLSMHAQIKNIYKIFNDDYKFKRKFWIEVLEPLVKEIQESKHYIQCQDLQNSMNYVDETVDMKFIIDTIKDIDVQHYFDFYYDDWNNPHLVLSYIAREMEEGNDDCAPINVLGPKIDLCRQLYNNDIEKLFYHYDWN